MKDSLRNGSGTDRALEFCPECGKKIESTFKLCPYCGFNLIERIPSPNEDSSDGYEEYIDPDEEFIDNEPIGSKIRKIVDTYIKKICKEDCKSYNSKEVQDPQYSQIFQNVRSNIATDAGQYEIVGYIDTTRFGKGKTGLVFTTSALHICDGEDPMGVPYGRMTNTLICNGVKILLREAWEYESGLPTGLFPLFISDKFNYPALKDCLDEIIALIKPNLRV